MDKINELSDDVRVKILSFVPTKVAVSTSILSKRWEFLWMWVPKLDLEYSDFEKSYDFTRSESPSRTRYRDFMRNNMPLHRAPIIKRLRLIYSLSLSQAEDIKLLVGIALVRCVREISITYSSFSVDGKPDLVLPSSLYTCESLLTLKLEGWTILVDVPGTVCLPSLKTMQLRNVTYMNEDSLWLLLSCCPVLEDLVIDREEDDDDGVKSLVVNVPSLQRLSLCISSSYSSDGDVIVTPCLKYFKVEDYRDSSSYLIKHMPKLEEAYIHVKKDLDQFLESITSVKHLELRLVGHIKEESMYRGGIVFDQLEHLEVTRCNHYWFKLLVRLLNDSPKLRVLNLDAYHYESEGYERINWSNELSSVPKCLLNTLETFKFVGFEGRPEERDFLNFLFQNACCLKSSTILYDAT